MSTNISSQEGATTALGAALVEAASKSSANLKVVKAKDAPPSQTPPEKPAAKTASKAEVVPVKKAVTSTSKVSVKPAAKTVEAKKETAEETPDPASFLEVASPSKPIPWFPETYTLAHNEKVRDSVQGKVIEIRLYAEACTECPSLVLPTPAEESELAKCHFSMGNIYCPAGYTRIRFVGEKMRLLHKMRKAKEKGDVNRLLTLVAETEALPIDDRREVLQEIGLLGTEIVSTKEAGTTAA